MHLFFFSPSSKVFSIKSSFSHNLTDNVQVSEVRVEEVGEQGQQSGSVSETVSWVPYELDGFRHGLLQLGVLLVTGHRLQHPQHLQSNKAKSECRSGEKQRSAHADDGQRWCCLLVVLSQRAATQRWAEV